MVEPSISIDGALIGPSTSCVPLKGFPQNKRVFLSLEATVEIYPAPPPVPPVPFEFLSFNLVYVYISFNVYLIVSFFKSLDVPTTKKTLSLK